MTVFGEVNRDALSLAPTEISRGKRLGFLEALEAARNEEQLYYSQFGAEMTFREMERENLQRIQDASGIYAGRLEDTVAVPRPEMSLLRYADEPLPGESYGRGGLLPKFTPYTKALEHFAFGGELPPHIRDLDKHIADFKKKYPNAGILTYSEMYNGLVERSDKARVRASRDTSWSGLAGWFIGGTIGALDPRVNPINFMSLPAGGVGRTAVMRIGSQAIGQGAAETAAQFTGARYNQMLLGGDPTAAETALRIGGTAVGGAAIQGVGEAVGWAARRWFRNTPDDPAPEPPAPPAPVSAPATGNVATKEAVLANRMAPTLEAEQAITRAVQGAFGRNPNALRAARSDFAYVNDQLSPFNGPAPWEIPPPSHTRLTQFGMEDFQAPRVPQPKTPGETVDDVARRVDPETFRAYDLLAARRQEQQALLDQRGHMRQLTFEEETKGLRAEIAKQEKRLETAKRRKAKEITEVLAGLRSKLGDLTENLPETIGMKAAREEIERLDDKIADMSQALARAYSRAQGKWEIHQETLKAVQQMVEEGRTEINMPPYTTVDAAELQFLNKPTVADLAPELRQSIARPVKEGQDAVDEVQRVAAEMLDQSDAAVDAFRALAARLTKPKDDATKAKDKATGKDEVEEETIDIEGFNHKIRLTDEIVIERADGTPETVSARDILQRLAEDEEVLKAVSTCSVVPTSATA